MLVSMWQLQPDHWSPSYAGSSNKSAQRQLAAAFAFLELVFSNTGRKRIPVVSDHLCLVKMHWQSEKKIPLLTTLLIFTFKNLDVHRRQRILTSWHSFKLSSAFLWLPQGTIELLDETSESLGKIYSRMFLEQFWSFPAICSFACL